MTWVESALHQLARQPICGYAPEQTPASEPTALASLALAGAGYRDEAVRAANWLAELQTDEGAVPVLPSGDHPCWTTPLALLAWVAVDPARRRFGPQIGRAVQWSLSVSGKRAPRSDVNGHDTTLAAWPWVQGTHSWVEPSALHVLAMKAAGYTGHPRTREAVKLLVDRQLPSGGCNYGNTTVLGRELRPHVQPTGTALVALQHEVDPSGRVQRSLQYLEQALDSKTSSASLGWGILGLTAHGRRPAAANRWLHDAAARRVTRPPSGPALALLVLAQQGSDSPLIAGTARERHMADPKGPNS